ncbi:MAG: FN3 associated domain-containing protein, partial [Oscillospiraceae bacterium]
MNDYTRTGANRYGEPTELRDITQEMTVTQDKSFALTIDKGNAQDKKAAQDFGTKMLMRQMTERAIPEFDKYIFEVLAHKAGTIAGNAVALSKANIVDRIADGGVVMDDEEISQTDRTLFISAEGYKLLKLSDEFISVDKLGEKALCKGVVGEFDNMKVVKVPKGRWPLNVNFIITQKSSATAPTKIYDAKVHLDPPGISGNLLEGRNYYDCFVIAARAKGVYAEVNTASGKGEICAVPSIAATTGALTSATQGVLFKYTTDGSDPRYSDNGVIGQPSGVAAGTVIKAYAYKDGLFNSPVSEKTI